MNPEHEKKALINAYPDGPRVGVGAVVIKNGQILLVQRGKPPSLGKWAIPGGSARLGENLRTAAEREVFEETGISVKALEPVDVSEVIEKDNSGLIRFHYVIVDFTANFLSGKVAAADDALDAKWVSSRELSEFDINASTLELLNKLHFTG